MNFTSPAFLFTFLPLCVVIYYAIPRRARRMRNGVLLAASFLFYGVGEPSFVAILAISVMANWFFGLFVAPGSLCRRGVLAVGLCANVALLFRFKYTAFAISAINDLTGLSLFVPKAVLPLGISFFTFQSMSYLVDVFRGESPVRRNPFDVALYISFFPQLVAGPIVRYETIAEEIDGRQENRRDFSEGLYRFVDGLAKKTLLANPMGALADAAFGGTNLYPPVSGGWIPSSPLAWLGAIAYTFQIYFDFSGYSDMAIGLGRMFGFHFLENFRFPYVSGSVSEFWRRWHISMGTWFRDYVYFPLGGSRCGTARLFANLFVVWTLTGLWHGANWTFVAWGLMYFILIAVEKTPFVIRQTRVLPRLSGWLYTMFFVVIGWVLFRSPSLSFAKRYLLSMFSVGNPGWNDVRAGFLFRENIVVMVLCALFCTPLPSVAWNRLTTSDNPICRNLSPFIASAWRLFLLLAAFSCIAKGMHNPFIYFNF